MSKITYKKLYRKSSFHSATSILKLECHVFILFFFFQIMWQEMGRALKTQRWFTGESASNTGLLCSPEQKEQKAPPVHSTQFKHSFWPLHNNPLGSWPLVWAGVSTASALTKYLLGALSGKGQLAHQVPIGLVLSIEGEGRSFEEAIRGRVTVVHAFSL